MINFTRLKNRWKNISLSSDSSEATSLSSLLEKHRSSRFEDFFQGHPVENEFGSFFRFHRKEPITLCPENWEKTPFPLLQNLKLILGIGDKTNEKLQQTGISSIHELMNHPRYGKASHQFHQALERENLSVMLSYCRSRLGYNHPDLLCLSTYHPADKLCFLDIETLGLFNCPLFLIGLAKWDGKNIHITQYLAPDMLNEKAVLSACQQEISPGSILITYNGDSFDIPFINDRLRLYQLPSIPRSPSYDMLLYVRGQWRNRLPDCRLQTVESSILGRKRKDDVPGSLVPNYYKAYLSHKNIGPLLPILEHNQLDLLSLMEIYFTMLPSPHSKISTGDCPLY